MEKKDNKLSKINEKKKKNSKQAVVVEKKKKVNVFKRIGNYFKGVFKEIKRIKWTSGSDLLKYSLATIMFVVFFGVYFYAIDWVVLFIRSLAK